MYIGREMHVHVHVCIGWRCILGDIIIQYRSDARYSLPYRVNVFVSLFNCV